ncbi:MAG: hypothetical protein GQ525_13695 [Draconibacterium sp.]|nr:hypothetical protein [Draconibacterium sp.]
MVVIFIDDMVCADLGCFGATEFETPNLDKMTFLKPQTFQLKTLKLLNN